jgi:hypothetical protein
MPGGKRDMVVFPEFLDRWFPLKIKHFYNRNFTLSNKTITNNKTTTTMKAITTLAILVMITISSAFAQSKKIDKSIVGTWMHQDMIASSGYGDYASYTSVTYYQLNADGTVCVTDGGSVSSGNDWSYNNGGGNAQCGKWYVQNGYLYLEQNGQLYGYIKYTLHNGQLVLGQSGNYTFLSRAY